MDMLAVEFYSYKLTIPDVMTLLHQSDKVWLAIQHSAKRLQVDWLIWMHTKNEV